MICPNGCNSFNDEKMITTNTELIEWFTEKYFLCPNCQSIFFITELKDEKTK